MAQAMLQQGEKYRPLTVKRILTKAKAVLRSKGWVQGTMSEDNLSKFCARGAMAIVGGASVKTHIGERWDDSLQEFVPVVSISVDDDELLYGPDRSPDYVKAVELTNTAAGEANGGECSLIGYNDLPGRTLEEVIAVFDKAINLLDAEVEAAKHIAA